MEAKSRLVFARGERCRGGSGENGNYLKGTQFPFWGDKSGLGLNRGGGYTTL